jgi:endonuclease G
MDPKERLSRLRAMLTQVAPNGNLESITAPSQAPAPLQQLGMLEGLFDTGDAFQSGRQKLLEGRPEELSAREIFTLEAIVMPKERPAAFVRGGTYDDIEAPWAHLNPAPVKERFKPMLRAIGRIELPGAPWLPFGGTGFVVGTNLVMTNRHVAALVTSGVGTRLQYQPGDAAVNFKREVESQENDQSAQFSIRSVLMIHPYWDMALLHTEGLEGYAPLRLSIKSPEELVGREILAIGYPARDDRSDLALQDRIFNKKYNVKRVQPGILRPRTTVRSFHNNVNALTHDSSTLGGNSGSAILDLNTAEVVGLHFAGEYLKANYAVPTYELARDTRVARANLNFAGTLSPTNDWEPAWQRAEAAEAAAQPPPAQQPPASPAHQSPPASTPAGSVTLTIPLHITLSLGTPTPALSLSAQPAAEPGTEAFPMAVPKIFGGLEHRNGYQPGFLRLDHDESVPLPELTTLGASVVSTLADGTAELKYHKFSVVMHKGRRMALFTAANVDWRPASRLIDGRKPSRKELTEIPDGTIEQWVTDWRIPEEHQLPDIFFTKDGGAFDKGHLVRRDDVCWGTPFKDMQKSNGDTYHTTNCSPQTAAFNRSKPSDEINNWGDLENLIQQLTKAEKAILFSGPVFEEDDQLFAGRDSRGKTLVRIPRSFWKIIVVKGASGPEAYGFVLEQDLSAVPIVEALPIPGKWRREMRSIEHIEALLHGLAQLSWLKKYDQFDSAESVRNAVRRS